MNGGYIGKILFVDLSTGVIKEEALEEKICRDFIGGYGIGARMLYSRQKAGVDPLGPENTLGLTTGPFTGTLVPTGARYAAVGKSPLTGGWGDANSGGQFGPYLKFSGFDEVFFTGISPKPVYLLIDNGKAELKDAGYLVGKGQLRDRRHSGSRIRQAIPGDLYRTVRRETIADCRYYDRPRQYGRKVRARRGDGIEEAKSSGGSRHN